MSKSDKDLLPGTSATRWRATAQEKPLGQEQQMAPASAEGRTVRYLNPDELYQPARHGFSQVTIVPAGTELVYVSGQMAIDVDGKILAADFEGQVKGAFANLRLALEAVGSSMDHVVKVTILSADHDGERERIVARETNAAFPGSNKPASTLIPVPRLALDGIVFEIDAVAVLPS
ncbi:RidA family protein [Sphingomonas bacterium]|uniref:RidA family protein n=1 Tax=Sphingomonas bacterium TaxID=1895847 RepID=UPI001C2D4B1F|nr:RidA family protein [Sphingomonas bacterium]